MLYLNEVKLIGNLASDAELKDLPSGGHVLKYSVAVNWSTGEKEDTDFFNVEQFGNVEGVHPHMTKGKQVMVFGRLKVDKWEDKETGEPRSMMKIQATRVELGSSPKAKDAA